MKNSLVSRRGEFTTAVVNNATGPLQQGGVFTTAVVNKPLGDKIHHGRGELFDDERSRLIKTSIQTTTNRENGKLTGLKTGGNLPPLW